MNIGLVTAVSISETHTMSKKNVKTIHLIEGLGIDGDAHMGKNVKHRSRVKKNPNQPNLRQIHLIHSELFSELLIKGFNIIPGEMGENITTVNIDLLSLPKDTILNIGKDSQIKITGLRNPCHQLNGIQDELMKAVLDKDIYGNLIRKAGVMGIILKSGKVSAGDEIRIEYPEKPFIHLEKV